MIPEKERKPDRNKMTFEKKRLDPLHFFFPVSERPFDLSL